MYGATLDSFARLVSGHLCVAQVFSPVVRLGPEVGQHRINATWAMGRRFERIREDDAAWVKVLTLRDELVETWSAPISAGRDELAPDRPRTGLFGPLAG